MSKIICDICGTEYPETAENCPICGCSKSMNLDELLDEELLQEDEDIITHNKGGKFTEAAVDLRYKDIFDFDEEDEEDQDDEEQEEDTEDEGESEEERKSNVFLVILLVIIITLLLAASGFLFVRYFLPNLKSEAEPTDAPTVATEAIETDAVPTTEAVIPCESLVITGDKAVLNMEGKNWLLDIVVMPEDTTDTVTFVSEDESVATVNADGRITAVGEGTTNIVVVCGGQQIKYPVEVQYTTETAPETDVPAPTVGETTGEDTPATEATQTPEETVGATEAATEPATEPAATEAATEPAGSGAGQPLKDVVLKLKRTDISLQVGYGFEIPLDCDLTYEEIEWSVEHNFIATVKNGFVTAVSRGTTEVTAKYGDQVVTCMVRCHN